MKHVGYPLKGDIHYVRKPSAPTLLLSLGRTLARLEHDGYTTESVALYPGGDGDWVGTVLVQDPDDLTLMDRDRGLRLLGIVEDDSEVDMGERS